MVHMSVSPGWLTLLIVSGCITSCRPESDETGNGRDSNTPAVIRSDESSNAVVDLVDSKVPRAVAGDPGWRYVQRATADFDGDGQNETAVLIANVELDQRGEPLWEDGHRWQLYFEEADSTRTYAYARFLPNGKLEASVTVPDEEKLPTVVLRELTPHLLGIYEVRYLGPQRSQSVRHLHRELEPSKGFSIKP